jgi:hypothetical protein
MSDKPPMNQKPAFHVTCMTAQNVFHECIMWCVEGLKAAGYPVTYADAQLKPDAINIVLASYCTPDTWTSMSGVAKNIIIYNWEPVASDHGRITQRYVRSLQKTHVWDYSRNNVEELARYAGVQDIHYVPMGFVPAMSTLSAAPEQDIDVLFYGTIYPRRRVVIDQMKSLGLRVVTSEECGNLSGAQRDQYIARAKVVLNMHSFDAVHVFEMARVSYLLANKKAVVCEVSEVTDIDDDLLEAVSHGKIDTLAGLCKQLVDDAAARRALELRGFELFSRRDAAQIMTAAVERYLILRDMTPPQIGNTQPMALPLPKDAQLGSGSIAQGYNERWSYRRCNIDARADYAPDIVLDVSQPIVFGQTIHTERFGAVTLTEGCFAKIDAQQLALRTTDLNTLLRNCLWLLQDDGVLTIPIYLNTSLEAWASIDDKRGFHEKSWENILNLWWQYGWGDYRLVLESTGMGVNSMLGYEILKSLDGDWSAAFKVPRAIDRQTLYIRKKRLTEQERQLVQRLKFMESTND